MTTATIERAPVTAPGPANSNGGLAARRAVVRWAWRVFRREWRQQLLVLSLIVVALAATFVGAAAATDSPPPANAGFGSAQDLATFTSSGSRLAGQIAAIEHRFGTVDVIENRTVQIPGSVDTYDIRAQDPDGAFGRPMLSLLSGKFPRAGQVALSSALASELDLKAGDTLETDGRSSRVVGIVQNPESLLDEFALVAPGELAGPTSTTVLFDAHGFDVSSLGANFESEGSNSSGGPFNPSTIVLALATIGILLIALVAIGGFTVLAQRRLRSIGMLGTLGASDANLSLVVRANGIVVGIVGVVIGVLLGFGAWLAYRPHLISSSHHVIGVFALPWNVIGPAMGIAVVATYFSASRPAKAIVKIPVVAALSGRPAPPRQIRRTALPGVVVLLISFFLLSYAGAQRNGGGAPAVLLGLVGLVAGIILLAPACLVAFARLFRGAPLAIRMAVRDLVRYRARSGSALSAISLGVLIAVLVCVLAASRYGNNLDYVGPNLASDQLILYTSNGPYGPGGPGNASAGNAATGRSLASMSSGAHAIANGLHATHTIELFSTSASLQHEAGGRQFTGPLYVATPQLLSAFGIRQSSIDPDADILSMRPGFSSNSLMQIVYGDYFAGDGPPGGGGGDNAYPCPRSECLADPVIQEVTALPSGTSAPNTVITEGAVKRLGLTLSASGWMIETPTALSAAQLTSTRVDAGAAGLSIESRNDQPTSAEIINWATVFGILLALAILAMTLGLIRSETASDLRTLAATGASSYARRALTAATAGSLALLGAVMGTAAAYIGVFGFLKSNGLDSLSSLKNVPITNLSLILIGMPVAAAVIGWVLSGREPSAMAHQPLE